MLKVLYLLLPFMMLTYPHGLLQGIYLNYVYIVFTFICFLAFDKNKIQLASSNRFLTSLFLIVLIGNFVSALKSTNINMFDYVSSTLRYLTLVFISTILLSTTNNRKQFVFWIFSFMLAYILSLVILFLDAKRIDLIEKIFKVSSFENLNTLDIYFRAYGSYLSPISAGIFLLNGFTLIVVLITSNNYQNKSIKIILIILAVATVLGIIMTASRTSIAGLAVVLVYLFVRTRQKITLLIFCLLVAAFFYSGFLDSYLDNIILRNEKETAYGSSYLEGSGRITTLENSIKLFFSERTFFTGVGPSEYGVGDSNFSLAHNGFLSIALCYGLFGVLLFLIYFKNLSLRVFKKKDLAVSKIHYNFIKSFFVVFILVNAVTFISSDGPVTTFWLYFFILFLYIMDKSHLLNINFKNLNEVNDKSYK